MNEITVDELRDIIAKIISRTIDFHRESKSLINESYVKITGNPTEDEIDDFIVSNVLYDPELMEQLLDPGLLGFQFKKAKVDTAWLKEFEENTVDWSNNQTWLASDEPWLITIPNREPEESLIWKPDSIIKPNWLSNSPSYLLLAEDLIRKGKLLSQMNWRDFEKLIAYLLEQDGWDIELTKATRDGGVDVIAIRNDENIGLIKSVWQAKKYGLNNKVKLHEIRELSTVRNDEFASKALIVTTNYLTKDAIDYIKRDKFRLGYKDNDQMIEWILKGKNGL
ncbi:restriction endonuclease [Labilibaculum sp. K2S]|uniref:restriction endonuclease n=1 Tax=Labilibaculum sp. K2S TaxID=3056386 RepID=UPI0025A34626|nr:restriction endonuclease [Labilibaculum sp. K2S]MDM8158995.1 restriction endonuclease [Labilibaculum sp. K2S]